MLQKFFKNKTVSKKPKLRLKNTTIDKTLTETWTLTKRDMWDTAGLLNDSRSKAHMMLFI